MRALIVLLAVWLSGLQLPAADTKSESTAESATVSALVWLGMIDEGDYGKSWDQAASYFRGAITKEQWNGSLDGIRKPLGKVIQRKAVSPEHHTSLPGAPDGEYYVLKFNTEFEHKKEALETVTLMLGEDGIWRASGYFIK